VLHPPSSLYKGGSKRQKWDFLFQGRFSYR